MQTRMRALAGASAVALLVGLGAGGAGAETTVTLWSHWADHESKVAFVEEAARAFEAAHPDTRVEITWYQKEPLYAALKTALRAGQGPDIFYSEPDQVEYIDNNLLLDLGNGLAWDSIEGWAEEVWTFGDGVYGFPLEAWTVEMYYDKAKLAELGFELPESRQFSQSEFLEVVKAAREAGLTPIALGVGDRPYPGAFLAHEAVLKKIGKEDYDRLLKGELSWDDERVQEALRYVQELVEAGALPESFSSLKLGESHVYFHTNPGALMFLMGSFYPSRAFNPPDKGGQPEGFELGIMKFPALDDAACNECKTITVGGSYSVNAASPHPELAVALLNTMATPEMGNKWLETVLVQTGIGTDPDKITGPHAAYFQELAALDADADYYIGLPMQVLQGEAREVFAQVVNHAFPAGLIGPEEVAAQMNATQ
jgi:multiple sugar transport system substrate-binding protein